eukprot:6487076-Amphidinium_carterae.2
MRKTKCVGKVSFRLRRFLFLVAAKKGRFPLFGFTFPSTLPRDVCHLLKICEFNCRLWGKSFVFDSIGRLLSDGIARPSNLLLLYNLLLLCLACASLLAQSREREPTNPGMELRSFILLILCFLVGGLPIANQALIKIWWFPVFDFLGAVHGLDSKTFTLGPLIATVLTHNNKPLKKDCMLNNEHYTASTATGNRTLQATKKGNRNKIAVERK